MTKQTGTKRHHRHAHKHTHKHRRNTDWREILSRYFFALSILVGVLVLGLGTMIGWGLYQAHLYQGVYAPEIEKDLGFTTGSPWVKAGGENVEVFVIQPVAGGYMGKIGFQDGDIITSHSITEFYKMLYTQRGELVSVDLVDGGGGRPIEDRKVRTLRFHIPTKG
jgi:hypothetical protein